MRHFESKALRFRVHPDGRVEKQDKLDPEREWLPAMPSLADLRAECAETDERGNVLPQPLDLQPCRDT